MDILKNTLGIKSGDIKNSYQGIRINGNKVKEYPDLLIPIQLENDGLSLYVGGKYLVIRSEESMEFNLNKLPSEKSFLLKFKD